MANVVKKKIIIGSNNSEISMLEDTITARQYRGKPPFTSKIVMMQGLKVDLLSSVLESYTDVDGDKEVIAAPFNLVDNTAQYVDKQRDFHITAVIDTTKNELIVTATPEDRIIEVVVKVVYRHNIIDNSNK